MSLPEILNVWFKIDESRLWALDLPVEEIPISEIENNLDILYLESEWTDDRNLSPRMLIENFDKEFFHAEKVQKADLNYPIEIYNNNWKYIILDWVHRFTKAFMLGAKSMKVRKISREIAISVNRQS